MPTDQQRAWNTPDAAIRKAPKRPRDLVPLVWRCQTPGCGTAALRGAPGALQLRGESRRGGGWYCSDWCRILERARRDVRGIRGASDWNASTSCG